MEEFSVSVRIIHCKCYFLYVFDSSQLFIKLAIKCELSVAELIVKNTFNNNNKKLSCRRETARQLHVFLRSLTDRALH